MEQKINTYGLIGQSKRLLRNKANFGVLEGFLTVLLGEKIQSWKSLRAKVTSNGG